MGKKVDLSKPRKYSLPQKNNRNNFRPIPTPRAKNGNKENNEPTNAAQINSAQNALKSMGNGIKSLASNVANASAGIKGGKLKLKIPVTLKIKIILIVCAIALPIILLMVFLLLLVGEEEGSNSGGATALAMAGKCRNVTVTQTQNNTYDGEVEFEDYIAGVVAAEIGIADNVEYYKVAAIAARTFFLEHTSNNCTVKGNATFQAYQDVEDSPYKDKIKQAVEETTGLVMVKDNELSEAYYASACVVNADSDYYYVRYGTQTLGEAQFQKIPKTWDSTSAFPGYLASWYSKVDQTSTDYDNKSCPDNHDYGMTQIGALYLITNENYDYKEVIKYYYGDVEIGDVNATANSEIVNGFINPVNNFNCSNGYGCRYHPIYKYYRIHSGVDLGASSGEPVFATKDGTITQLVNSVPGYSEVYGYGNYITIQHADGSSSRYAHLLYGSIPDSLHIGSSVSQGEIIAQVGSTGTSTGPHLHYEVHVKGTAVNPYYYLDLANRSDAAQCNSNADVPMSYCGY